MIDLKMLKEMTHNDLVSVGVKAVEHRHKILKELRSQKSNNIVQTMLHEVPHPTSIDRVSFDDTVFLGYDSCDKIFKTIPELVEHFEFHSSSENTHYGAGILFDDIRLPVQTLETTNLENIAESTRLNDSSSTLHVTVIDNVEHIVDLTKKKRKRGECSRDNIKKLKYRLH